MKKLLGLLLTLVLFLGSSAQAERVKFDEGLAMKKPLAVLVYASWADDLDKVALQYGLYEQSYDKKYNFAYIDIATEDAKSFNKKFQIYQDLPYVLLFKDNGKITRYLKKDCIMDNGRFKQRLDFFVN